MTSAIANRRSTRRAAASGIAASALALAALAPRPALADPTRAEDKATAEALFKHARELMKQSAYAEACPKLAESQRLDPGIGTMLYLADCYEHQGLLASAWNAFNAAAAAARAAGETEREQKAVSRAAALQPRLAWVTVTLGPSADLPGLQVRGDGRALDRSLLGQPIALDAGDHAVSASAPGKAPWSTKVHVDAGSTQTVAIVIPRLGDAPVDGAPVVPPVAPAAPPPSGAAPIAARPAPVVLARDPETPPGRKAGYALIGVGLGTTAIGGILGAVVLGKRAGATAGCRADGVCLPSSASSVTSAIHLALASTVTLSVSAGIFVTGLVVTIATRPAEEDRMGGALVRVGDGSPNPRAGAVQLRPLAGPGLAGLAAGGAF
jgi:serine/threonine-protein kinase